MSSSALSHRADPGPRDRTRRALLFGGLALGVAGAVGVACSPPAMTQQEAKEALDEVVWSARAGALTSDIAEISTNFTLGQAVDAAAKNLRDFLVSQIPCAKVTLLGATVTTDFGATGGTCTYNGHVWTGRASVTVQRNDANSVEVLHEWDELSNGDVTVDGSATVTWNSAVGTRRIVHTATATDGKRTVTGSGDRTQKLVDPSQGWAGGIQVDGTRSWQTARGTWDLTIEAVQLRAQDPVPQAGTYQLLTPDGHRVTVSFERISDDQIRVTLTGGRREFQFVVASVKG